MLTNEDLDRIAELSIFRSENDGELVRELVRMARLGALVLEKFASGNSAPVERITIRRQEYQAIEGERG